jgi:restriction system protein
MSLWLVRAGRYGEQEVRALEKGLVSVGWKDLPDLSGVKTRDELVKLFEKTYPNRTRKSVANQVGQIWAFVRRIERGDLVVLPLKAQSAIAVARVEGGYEYRNDLGEDMHHVRRAKWLRTDIPRAALDQDLLLSFGAFMTVCQVTRNKAEERVETLLKQGSRGMEGGTLEKGSDLEPMDIEQIARDQIVDYINRKFKGHDLARLVEAVLQAEGYVTTRSEPGPDGGVDILAGSGPMGFEPPRVCVQVKSASSTADVTVFRSLQGTVQQFKAEQGLLISWGGFNRKVVEEARRSFFSIRMWDSGDLLEAILKSYDRFPDALKAELPLKRTWTLVLKEE